MPLGPINFESINKKLNVFSKQIFLLKESGAEESKVPTLQGHCFCSFSENQRALTNNYHNFINRVNLSLPYVFVE